jgi:membrane associated rhomboid family serine protease
LAKANGKSALKMYTEIKNDIVNNWKNGDAYVRLILSNVAVFLILLLGGLLIDSSANLSSHTLFLTYLGFSSNPLELLFHPWTILSHMFVHLDVMHLISNLLLLNFAGHMLFLQTSNAIFYRIYFLSGFAGILALFIVDNVLVNTGLNQDYSVGIGASACVMGCLVCVTVLNPKETVNLLLAGPIKLMYVTAFLISLDLIYLYASNTGGHIAHLAGAGMGWWYGERMRKGHYPGGWINKILGFFTFTPKTKLTVSHRRPISDEEYNAQKVANQAEIDTILDKISRSGYDSLTKREKDILHKASQK